MLRSQSN